ncbi:hypothetical protein L202_00924 [Cryptococcus amylolentus CBS 6039]|uniref:Uncharacterized protein n=2 Tax=Cryptococcus amylolentus TaxID=104669 RepID=A0A1E3IBF3_9TREE|nr:hypothetical protein L202_00924 [Cryptococcus amylolentus CBS 6039]ODN85101.1 hypothetical protein L202_00924 [Cryptococcus amylolentus CBS 6039]ODO11230.1 hypothetical protein I350_00005 [Cryptococcus amylolentus CBS 6273]
MPASKFSKQAGSIDASSQPPTSPGSPTPSGKWNKGGLAGNHSAWESQDAKQQERRAQSQARISASGSAVSKRRDTSLSVILVDNTEGPFQVASGNDGDRTAEDSVSSAPPFSTNSRAPAA